MSEFEAIFSHVTCYKEMFVHSSMYVELQVLLRSYGGNIQNPPQVVNLQTHRQQVQL